MANRRILGIDPGSKVTGYGIVELTDKARVCYIASGCIRSGSGAFMVRLGEIYRGVVAVIDEYEPSELAIEDVFVSKNVASALKLGQAKGVAIAAAISRDLPTFEYSPRKVKKSLVGNGSASKGQVQHMVKAILSLQKRPPTDASDALAIGICHVNTSHS